jgi:beta-lactam-binding protein with PASTA domain
VSDPDQAGVVSAQVPQAGAAAKPGDTVSITVGRFVAPPTTTTTTTTTTTAVSPTTTTTVDDD